jgi:hypothetical protein
VLLQGLLLSLEQVADFEEQLAVGGVVLDGLLHGGQSILLEAETPIESLQILSAENIEGFLPCLLRRLATSALSRSFLFAV